MLKSSVLLFCSLALWALIYLIVFIVPGVLLVCAVLAILLNGVSLRTPPPYTVIRRETSGSIAP